MIQIAPIGLREKVDRFNVAYTFVGGDDENIVEYERVRDGVGVANRDEQQRDNESARRGDHYRTGSVDNPVGARVGSDEYRMT